MRITVTEAERQLADLVRRAEAGDEIILMRHGHEAVRLVPIDPILDKIGRSTILNAVKGTARDRATSGPGAADSQHFLYGDDGLPR